MFERTHQLARARAALAGREGGRPDLMVTDVGPERVASPRRLQTFRGELDLAILPSRSVETMRGYVVDMTPMRSAVAALRRSELLNRSVVGALDEGVIVFDASGRAVSVNGSAERILGLPATQMIGHSFPFPGPHRIDLTPSAADAVAAALEHGTDAHGELGRLIDRTARLRSLISFNLRGLRAEGDARHYGLVASLTDVTEREESAQQLREERDRVRHLAYHDALTGLPNRAALEEHLRTALARARSRGTSVALLYFDLDNFKLVNDSLGHAAGDEVLREAARRVRSATRAGDVLARQGGDEFLLMLADLTADAAGVAAAVSRLVAAALDRPFLLGEDEFQMSASIGVSVFPHDAGDADGLLMAADAAMYRAKRAGKGTHAFYEPHRADPRERLSLLSRLRRALDGEELELYYQPVYGVADGRLHGAEALLRWNDPLTGLVAPNDFIPVAEDSGLIAPIGEWVLDALCRQLASWNAAGHSPSVSFNLSPREVDRAAVARRILDTIAAHGVDPASVCVELTESAVMAQPERSTALVSDLHDGGLRLAIDDFGTGHSSLTRLRELPFDVLKIDRSFLREVPGRRDAASIVAAVLSLAGALGLTTVAEGVEDAEQLAFLAGHGCPLAQGFHLGRPMPAADMTALLAEAAYTLP